MKVKRIIMLVVRLPTSLSPFTVVTHHNGTISLEWKKKGRAYKKSIKNYSFGEIKKYLNGKSKCVCMYAHWGLVKNTFTNGSHTKISFLFFSSVAWGWWNYAEVHELYLSLCHFEFKAFSTKKGYFRRLKYRSLSQIFCVLFKIMPLELMLLFTVSPCVFIQNLFSYIIDETPNNKHKKVSFSLGRQPESSL